MQEKSLFMRLGLGLVLLQLGAFVFSTPPFRAGAWHVTEPLMLAHFITAALMLLWLAYGYAKGQLPPLSKSPVLTVLFLWIGLQIITVAGSEAPLRAWFASPGNGEGTAWWVALLAGAFTTAQLWKTHAYRHILLMWSAAIILLLVIMHFVVRQMMLAEYTTPNAWEPNNWPDYLAFLAAYLWLAYCAAEDKRPLLRIAIIGICLLALLNSFNLIGILLVCAALIISLFAQISPRFNRIFLPSKNWRMLATIACILPMAWWVYCFNFQYEGTGFASENSFIEARNEGLGSRLQFNKVAADSLTYNPQLLLFGEGFGHFTDDLFQHGLVDGTAIFKNGKRSPNWILLDGTAYHSHSQPLEALLSFGLAGLIIFLALPVTLLWALPKPVFWHYAPMIVALTVLGYFWFEIPHVLGMHALALGALLVICIPTGNTRKVMWPVLLCIAGAIAMIASSVLQWQRIQYGNTLLAAARTSDCSSLTPEFLASDIPHGAERLNDVALSYTLDLAARISEQQLRAGDSACLDMFFDTAKAVAADTRSSDYAASLWLQMHYEMFISLQHPAFDALRTQAEQSFVEAATQLAARAPLRDDKAAIFLINLGEYTDNDVNRQIDILQSILTAAPTHRSAQWLMGYLLAQYPDTQAEGNAMKQAAIRRGVERVFPITKE